MTTIGTLTNLVSFDYQGYSPSAGLVQGSDQDFYGTTSQGGTNGFGTVFRLSQAGNLTNLFSFNRSNGANPSAALVQGQDGSFYGTTYYGGTNGYGTAFKLATSGTLNTLVSFNETNGAYPQAPLVQAADGSLYGTSVAGGPNTNQSGFTYGTVFRLTTNGTLTTVVSFNGTNGAYPQAGVVQGTDGSFYGTTASGGASGNGTVFRLSVTPRPAPVFQSVAQESGTLSLTWSAVTGLLYQMQRRTSFDQVNWSNFGGVVTATNDTMATLDAIGPVPQRMYRVVLLP
jgi:uncharacterized repeat protein (TIGR03803 family)